MRGAAILAGGMGRRMGKPKLFLKRGNLYLYKFLYDELGKSMGRVTIVLSKELSLPEPVPGLEVLYDDDGYSGSGPLGGLYTALVEMKGEFLFVCSVDMPFVSGNLAAYLIDRLESSGEECLIPFVEGKPHPLCAAYRKRGAGKIRKSLDEGEFRVSSLLSRLDSSLVGEDELRADGISIDSFANINTPGDIKKFFSN